MEKERSHLKRLIGIFEESCATATATPIQPLFVQGNEAVKHIATCIGNAGFHVSPLMSPTVQRGKELIRICLHAFNTEEELRALLYYLEDGRYHSTNRQGEDALVTFE